MSNTNYKQAILKANTIEELNSVKNAFLSECDKRENKIKISNILQKVGNFGSAKNMFESMIVSLLPKKDGKKLINKYVSTIKENKSLKTIYTYIEGLNENKTVDSKKVYITEALSLASPINYNEYVKGVGDIISIITEAFDVLGDEFVLNNVVYNPTSDLIGESLTYLSTSQKNIKNLNEYINHLDIVTEKSNKNISENINVDSTLEDIVSEMKQNMKGTDVSNIFETENKAEAFQENKQVCLEMISRQKNSTTDTEIIAKLNEMEEKLSKKQYTFETYTKDMLYMTELQEVLK